MIKRPPGPKGLPLIGSFLEFQRDRLGFLLRVAEHYGDVSFFRFGPRNIYFINNPQLIEDVLIKNNRKFTKSKVLQRAKIIVGEGLLTSESKQHLQKRRAIQPLFHNRAIPSYGGIMVDEAVKLTGKWKDGETIDLHNEMMKLTQTIVVKTLFGADIGDKTQQLVKSLNYIMGMFPKIIMPFSELLDYLPLPSMRKLRKEIKFLDETIYDLVRHRKENRDDKNDLLNVLLNTKDENGDDFFTARQIRDELITFFIAGQETTSNSLCWTYYLLSQNPDVEKRLHSEIVSVIGDKLPAIDNVKKLKLAENIFNESLRMYPPAWIIARRAKNDYKIKNYTVPAGSDIYMSQYVMHHDSRFFTDPYKFKPERWEERSDLPRFAFFPFGGGTRRCIGEPFAYIEAVLLMSVISQKWELTLHHGFKVEMEPFITIRPKYGLKMILKKR